MRLEKELLCYDAVDRSYWDVRLPIGRPLLGFEWKRLLLCGSFFHSDGSPFIMQFLVGSLKIVSRSRYRIRSLLNGTAVFFMLFLYVDLSITLSILL